MSEEGNQAAHETGPAVKHNATQDRGTLIVGDKDGSTRRVLSLPRVDYGKEDGSSLKAQAIPGVEHAELARPRALPVEGHGRHVDVVYSLMVGLAEHDEVGSSLVGQEEHGEVGSSHVVGLGEHSKNVSSLEGQALPGAEHGEHGRSKQTYLQPKSSLDALRQLLHTVSVKETEEDFNQQPNSLDVAGEEDFRQQGAVQGHQDTWLPEVNIHIHHDYQDYQQPKKNSAVIKMEKYAGTNLPHGGPPSCIVSCTVRWSQTMSRYSSQGKHWIFLHPGKLKGEKIRSIGDEISNDAHHGGAVSPPQSGHTDPWVHYPTQHRGVHGDRHLYYAGCPQEVGQG